MCLGGVRPSSERAPFVQRPPNLLGTAPGRAGRCAHQPLSFCPLVGSEAAGRARVPGGTPFPVGLNPAALGGAERRLRRPRRAAAATGTMWAAAGTALQGLFAVYKPPGMHWRAARETVKLHLIKGLNSLKYPEPCQQICFQPIMAEKEGTGKELTMMVSQVPMLADHPLVSGPVFTELNVGAGPHLDMQSSGVFVLGVGHGTKLIKNWHNAHFTRAYTVSGLFGKATDNFSDTGKLIEKSTFDHVTREKLERIVSVIQGSNHKALLQPPPSLSVLPQRLYSQPQKPDDPESSEPLCFTKSPANPRRWTTWQSMGSDQQQPAWQALLINLVIVLILLWCYLRPETEADQRAEEFMEYLRNYPLQQLPPSIPSGEGEKEP